MSGTTNPISFNMPATDINATANFSLVYYTLTVTKNGTGDGQIKLNDVLHSLPYTEQALKGTTYQIEAIHDAGSEFAGWSGSYTASTPDITFSLDSDKDLTATFNTITGGKTGKFDFNDGTTQGWTQEGAYNENEDGPLNSHFYSGWEDDVNYPNPPGDDPAGDSNGSFFLFTDGGHGVNSPGSFLWMMHLYSPDLSTWDAWQDATGYEVEIAECMGVFSLLWANLFVTVYDSSQNKDRYFYNGDILELAHDDYGDDEAVWNKLTFQWSGIPAFPAAAYTVKNIFVDVWGEMTGTFEGGVYLDEVTAISSTAVRDKPETSPSEFALSANYPDPFNSSTTIEYRLPGEALVSLDVYDVRGIRIRTLVQERKPAGSYTARWDGKDDSNRTVASGIYICRLEVRTKAEIYSDDEKLIFTK
jgi:hypothetical protein